jgi:LacI family repressor for deo operon, udp, cdd, tsx, nupC, and nupG
VLIDQQSGGYQATDYLARLGHRQIAYIIRSGVHWQQRIVGYRRALLDNRIAPDPAYEVTATENWDELADAFKQLMTLQRPPTAIIAPSDMAAWGLCRTAHALGYEIPRDVSIMGFGNTIITEKTDIPLTTVDHPKREIGVQAMLMLKDLMEGNEVTDSLFKPNVVVRGSTCPPHLSE